MSLPQLVREESVQSPDMEPACAALVERRRVARTLPPYEMSTLDEITDALNDLLASQDASARVSSIARLGGGASKEQFVFDVKPVPGGGPPTAGRYVLRTDPQCPIIETDCRREFALLNAMNGVVPVPEPTWLDGEGRFFGRPAMITEFVAGVTKPVAGQEKVSGLGTRLGEPLRSLLKQQFLDILVRIHAFDWQEMALEGFGVPNADPAQAARWSLNFWDALWTLDKVEDRPIATLVRCWLMDNVPDCQELVLTHGDYRTGNYLFDEDTGKIAAVLDWELARIGDFHEDLAWVLMRLFSFEEDGILRASDLYEREEFISSYESASGRTVNRKTLHFYEVLGVWKCYIIVAASGLSVSRRKHSHQDIVLTYMSAAGAMFAHDLAELLGQEVK